MNKPAKIYFAELTHTYITVDAKNTPLAIGYIAAYAKKQLQDQISIGLFKYPNELNDALVADKPDLIAFSNYMWNEELSYTFARRLKEIDPAIVIVFGGPNYPADRAEQTQYLTKHPEIDFYIDGEGEQVFSSLLSKLLSNHFDLNETKREFDKLSGIHYRYQDGTIVNGPAKRIANIEENIPSPYLAGIMDKFFDKNLTPLLQTSRGCPYSCTFCHDGAKYASKVYRYSNERIEAELVYAAQKTQVPSLTLADLNWGIFPQDIEVAKLIKEIQSHYHWPLNIQTATAKNQKDRIVEMSKILGNSMIIGASIQSNDDEVLKQIKRQNIGYEAIVKMATESASTEASTFTEIILCLPGDTKQKHFKSVYDMLDAGIQDMNLYQFILLPGTEAANLQSRQLYNYRTAYRVIPRCHGYYDILDETKLVSEIHEVVIGHSTMPHDDYVECRQFDLTLMIFNNGKILDEIYKSAAHLGLKRSEIITAIHKKATAEDSDLRIIYDAYREDEEMNFWPTKEALQYFLSQENGIDLYISGERGRNQTHYWKSVAIFEHLHQVVDCACSCIEALLAERGLFDNKFKTYFSDLGRLIELKKGDPTDVENIKTISSTFDFSSLEKSRYLDNPFEMDTKGTLQMRLAHTPERKKIIASYFEQYGKDIRGLAHLTHRYPAHILYRQVEQAPN
jgi:tRNA A37 methylthiotransferase MiaB